MRSTKKRYRELTINIGIACAALFICVLLIEGAAHLFLPKTYTYWQPDKDLQIDLVPGIERKLTTAEYDVTIRINDQGNRGTEASPDHRQQIVMTGDSFTFGFGVEEEHSFAHLTQERLGIPVINLGVQGAQAESVVKRTLLKIENLNLSPDVIVYSYYANDLDGLDGNLVDYDFESRTISFTPFDPSFVFSTRIFLARNSWLYNLIYRIKTKSRLADFALEEYYTLPPRFSQDWKNTLSDKVEKLDLLVETLKIYAESRESALVIVYIPEKIEVDDGKLEEYLTRYGVSSDDVYINTSREIIHVVTGNQGVPLIDLTPIFRSRNVNNSLYFPVDGHFNELGHDVASEIISAYLRTEIYADE